MPSTRRGVARKERSRAPAASGRGNTRDRLLLDLFQPLVEDLLLRLVAPEGILQLLDTDLLGSTGLTTGQEKARETQQSPPLIKN